ncbi:quinone-dependent dihydroorotate dehydrogenase [Fimbriiglobus ruber]|uniref:Dihydroorotate dehydrogenase (quinone) n=1 Tax=Fimbriiglobus ruber TaxID=1908690 RepID=A0A225DWV0_9BACT|nr:quinone-dependent dihydroorotate dehydrogenase [Fimbriiglobus ruber]OWK40805.1 Dihydroorotate dehydrogenase [Fimbriiglobus ruber]
MLYQTLLRPALFRLDAERAHTLALTAAASLARSRTLAQIVHDAVARPRSRPVDVLGLTFPNPVGLAGGMDKNAVAPLAWWAFGFGFLELGTVTPRPQAGNDKPRMFRFPATGAVVNRMGFNNAGAVAVADRLADQTRRGLRPPIPIGISVGKNKDTSAERAADDFAGAAAVLAPHADFVTINVSSPNTVGLRALQNAADVRALVAAVRAASGTKPVLVKVAPELGGADLMTVLDAALEAGAAGFIATNTLSTAGRPDLPQGGLSGRPLREIALKKVAEIRAHIGTRAALIGCGGIDDAASARAMLSAGADLVQIYTGLVYEGPFLAAEVTRELAKSSGRESTKTDAQKD